MTNTLSIRFAGIALAAFAFTGCMAPEDSEGEIDFDVDVDLDANAQGGTPPPPEVVIGACYHGATTEVHAININAPRCDLSKVQGIYDWAVADGQLELVEFLQALDGHATIQCRPYFDFKGDKRWCADVIDRNPDGSPLVKGTQFDDSARNYFVAYTTDADDSADRDYWNKLLTNPLYTAPPVELSESGFIVKNGQFVPEYDNTSRGFRLLKFDPRDCPYCGLYSGPGISYVTNPGLIDVSNGWWPPVTSSSCNIWTQQWLGQWAHMGTSTCAAEYNYRATSR